MSDVPPNTANFPAPLRTDYLSHDDEYRRRRSLGRTGWDDAVSIRQTLAVMEPFLVGVLHPGSTIIEFGCGAGDLTLHFAAQGFRVTGIDIAPFAIEWAREKAVVQNLAATFLVADLTRELPASLSPADFVLDGHCFHCIIGHHRAIFLRHARRCLKPGGLLHVHTMCAELLPKNARGFDPEFRCIMGQGIALRYFGTPASILQELQTAGFAIERHRVIPAQYDGDEDCLLVNARRIHDLELSPSLKEVPCAT